MHGKTHAILHWGVFYKKGYTPLMHGILAEVKGGSHLATEGAGILGMLANLNLLHHLPKRSSISGTIFTHNSNLLGALGLLQ